MAGDAFAAEVARIREESETLRAYGAEHRAAAVQRTVERLEAAHHDFLAEELSAVEAAAETGYREEHLRDLARQGRLVASKHEGEWRFRRCDLPRKAADRPNLRVVDEMAGRLAEARR
jgi:hypothetical protein